MAPRKNAAAEKAAENATDALNDETPATTDETEENAAVVDSGANLTENEDDGTVAVVVLPKNTLKCDGKTHRPHARVRVPASDVDRLVKRRVVVTAEQALADALAQEGVTIAVQDGVRIGTA
ncbi:hypothetical protein [Pantoea stewartii]|uniref:Uncharacterized protein n=1 Tax=Pantoea stewartii subsp. stewartii DC283 TaxID=660596 RepID=H3RLM6_PANSE|nr:hypothetical protein [Pantoea stewartii]ARF52781.1 hypothetical protein DSJ_26610 [Pantoea stewartii subsp. stewartii DC283]EHT97739.1 hypothetical protein CKS_5601 [Pantoea stewartii subsp. stewartii DC283]KAB0553985.1 hypothetical protein F7Q90_12390 [Pantoea stewartii subsp. stewartii]